MGTTLTGTTPQDTYDSLIKVTDNGPLTGSLKKLTDGLGNDSALALSTGAASVTGTLEVSSTGLFVGDLRTNGNFSVGNTSVAGVKVAQIYPSATSAPAIIQGVHAGVGPYDLAFQTSGGNVGIGTSAPTNKLVVKSAGYGAVASFLDASDNGFVFKADGFNGFNAIDQTQQLIMNFSGSEKYRFYTDGVLAVGSAIQFPATQVASADANTLDDYEEGTFTPTVSYSTSGTPTYAVQNGVYTKIGRSVQVQIVLSWNENGAVGDITIQGLPFTSVNTYRSIPSILSFGLTGLPTAISVTGIVFGNSTSISLFLNDNAATTLTDAYTDNDQDLYVTVTYQAA